MDKCSTVALQDVSLYFSYISHFGGYPKQKVPPRAVCHKQFVLLSKYIFILNMGVFGYINSIRAFITTRIVYT